MTTATDGVHGSDATTLDDHIASADERTTNDVQMEHEASLNVSPSPPNAAAMYRTIAALLQMADNNQSHLTGGARQTHATNTTNTGNNCDVGTVDEIDSYNEYFKRIGIHFQKSSNRVPLESQPESANQSECHGIDGDHFNEYNSIADLDCSATNANVHCTTDNTAMQCSSLWSSSASTNQQSTNENAIESAIDRSSNINRISNSVSNNNNSVEPNTDCVDAQSAVPVQMRRKAPNTLNLILSNTTILNATSTTGSSCGDCGSGGGNVASQTKKRKISALKRTYKQMNNTKYSDRFALNGITEECEYDSDIGKFNCKIGTSDQLMSDTSSGSYEFSDETATIRTSADSASSNDEQSLNDLNSTPKHRNHDTNHAIEWFNFNKSEKISVMKRIEFFENINNKTETKPKTEQNRISSIVCLASFMFAVIFLYFFPLAS